jgi:hypothetical protein
LKKRSDALTGAPSPADVNDPYIQEIAGAAVAEVDRRSNALYRQKVVRIVEAHKQVIRVCSWFQTLAMFLMLSAFFWLIHRCRSLMPTFLERSICSVFKGK